MGWADAGFACFVAWCDRVNDGLDWLAEKLGATG